MLDEIRKYLPDFPTVVLIAFDNEGCPYNVRVRPVLMGELVRFDLPAYVPVQPGPASILGHSHDDHLWNLKSLGIKGTLEKDAQGWYLRPTQFVPGAGSGANPLKMILGARKAAKNYLEARHIPKPKIPWDEIRAFKEAATKDSRASSK